MNNIKRANSSKNITSFLLTFKKYLGDEMMIEVVYDGGRGDVFSSLSHSHM